MASSVPAFHLCRNILNAESAVDHFLKPNDRYMSHDHDDIPAHIHDSRLAAWCPDLRYLAPKKHEQFIAVMSGAKLARGMPGFASVREQKDMELIRQCIIKRPHNLKGQLEKSGRVSAGR